MSNEYENINPVDEVSASLNEVGITEQSVIDAIKALGVSSYADFAELEKSDLIAAGLNPVQANKLIKGANTAGSAINEQAGIPSFDGILPDTPDEENWLNALKMGGVLKPDQSTVIAAIRALLAEKVGLFDVPAKLLFEMERFADENDEPVDQTFFKLRQQVTQRTYAEVFEAIPGLDAEFVTDERKRQLFERMRKSLHPALETSYTGLKSWHDNWIKGASNPAMMMAAISGSGAMPPGMMAPPDTGVLHDYGDDINNAVNAALKGVGSQIASALAYDAGQIRKILDDPGLPMLIGSVNREQMLKKLNINISANYARQEQNLVKYALSFMKAKDVPREAEASYFSALCTLGGQLDWNVLSIRSSPPNLTQKSNFDSYPKSLIKIPDKL